MRRRDTPTWRRCDPDARVGRVDHRTKHALLQAGIQRIAERCAAYPPASAAQPKRVAAIGRFEHAHRAFARLRADRCGLRRREPADRGARRKREPYPRRKRAFAGVSSCRFGLFLQSYVFLFTAATHRHELRTAEKGCWRPYRKTGRAPIVHTNGQLPEVRPVARAVRAVATDGRIFGRVLRVCV